MKFLRNFSLKTPKRRFNTTSGIWQSYMKICAFARHFFYIFIIFAQNAIYRVFWAKNLIFKKKLRFEKFSFWGTVRATVVQSSKERCHFEEWDMTNLQKRKKRKKYMIEFFRRALQRRPSVFFWEKNLHFLAHCA